MKDANPGDFQSQRGISGDVALNCQKTKSPRNTGKRAKQRMMYHVANPDGAEVPAERAKVTVTMAAVIRKAPRMSSFEEGRSLVSGLGAASFDSSAGRDSQEIPALRNVNPAGMKKTAFL